MEARRVDGVIRLGPQARQQFYDARGIGRPHGDGLALAWVEAAYLLVRGDLEAVDGTDVSAFLSNPPDPGALARLVTYRDLRDRGYYLAVAYPPGEPPATGEPALHVRPRGASPTGDAVAHRLRVVTEGATVALNDLDPGALAVVDDEAEVTYLGIDDTAPTGEHPPYAGPSFHATLSGDRAIAVDPPSAVHDRAFFGRFLADEYLVLNLLEASHLLARDHLDIPGGASAVTSRARASIGETFDARAAVYDTLREQGLIPRSGLKFGATFRVYDAIESAQDPGHSRLLVDVHAAEESVPVQSLSRAVRLATGVRKTHVLAIRDGEAIRWRQVERLTP